MGEWIEKTEPPHYCQQPESGDHYEMEFGSGSVWKCDCGKEWIFHEFWGWELLSEHERKMTRWEADSARQEEILNGPPPARDPWWKKLVTPRDEPR